LFFLKLTQQGQPNKKPRLGEPEKPTPEVKHKVTPPKTQTVARPKNPGPQKNVSKAPPSQNQRAPKGLQVPKAPIPVKLTPEEEDELEIEELERKLKLKGKKLIGDGLDGTLSKKKNVLTCRTTFWDRQRTSQTPG
jgi:hypothetical protein